MYFIYLDKSSSSSTSYTLFFNYVTIYNIHVARAVLLINNNKLMTTVADAVAATHMCTTAPLHANISDSR